VKKSSRKKVLFVCLGNSCRSPMAEAIARHLAADVIEASSAGLTPLGHVESMTKQTLAQHGYLSQDLISKPLRRSDLDAADIVINLTGGPRVLEFDNFARVEDWLVEDPYGADAETYQRIFEDIERRVARLADRLRKEAGADLSVGDIKGKGTRGQ
jgi:protein-tyrosine-phosphatase